MVSSIKVDPKLGNQVVKSKIRPLQDIKIISHPFPTKAAFGSVKQSVESLTGSQQRD
jgi:hypothetical protein